MSLDNVSPVTYSNTMKIKTWMIEQTELLALVICAVYLQSLTGLDAKGWALALASAAGVMVSQKVRSGADRQAEQNALARVTPARLHCAAVMKRWGLVLQVLSTATSAATAATWGHWLVLGWVTLYPVRRKLYRLWKPAVLESAPRVRWLVGGVRSPDDGRLALFPLCQCPEPDPVLDGEPIPEGLTIAHCKCCRKVI